MRFLVYVNIPGIQGNTALCCYIVFPVMFIVCGDCKVNYFHVQVFVVEQGEGSDEEKAFFEGLGIDDLSKVNVPAFLPPAAEALFAPPVLYKVCWVSGSNYTNEWDMFVKISMAMVICQCTSA